MVSTSGVMDIHELSLIDVRSAIGTGKPTFNL